MSVRDQNEEGDANHDDNSEATTSRRSSITHPYPQLMKDLSFARCNMITQPTGDIESFVRSLIVLGHGYPIWDPIGPYNRARKHFEKGVSIGDVGLVNYDGDFHFLFNIFLPPHDPGQVQVPSNFNPLTPLDVSEIEVDSSSLPAGISFASEGVTIERIAKSPLELKFTVKGREGAVVVLPQGALRTNLTLSARKRVRDYVAKHTLDWYTSMNHVLYIYPNGSLYVVTGTDKASTWGLGCAPASSSYAGDQASFTYKEEGVDSEYNPWTAVTNAVVKTQMRTIPKSLVGLTKAPPCAIFIRGLRLAISTQLWIKHLLQNRPPVSVPYFNMLDSPIMGYRARRLTAREHRLKLSPVLPETEPVIAHPLDTILQIILEKSPKAKIAILDDYILMPVFHPHNLIFSEAVSLISRTLDSHELIVEDSMATLVPKSIKSKDPKRQRFYLRLVDYVMGSLRRRKDHMENLESIAKYLPGPGPY